MSTERQDRRRAERVTVDWTARLETEEGRVREGQVADVSTIGLRFTTDGEPVPSETPGTLTITFFAPDGRMDVVNGYVSADAARSAYGQSLRSPVCPACARPGH